MTLEAMAREAGPADVLAYAIENTDDGHRPMVCDVRPMIRDLVNGLAGGESIGRLAAAFHETCSRMLADVVEHVGVRTGLCRVLLSGGCFANRLLLERLTERLRAGGFEVISHREVPTGDGGIALGQAVVAAERLRRGLVCV